MPTDKELIKLENRLSNTPKTRFWALMGYWEFRMFWNLCVYLSLGQCELCCDESNTEQLIGAEIINYKLTVSKLISHTNLHIN